MGPPRIDSALVERLYREARGDRWRLPARRLHLRARSQLHEGVCRTASHTSRELSKYLSSLHLEDFALACACAEGHADAWDHFVVEMRPHLYRAADALDPSGGARDLADSLYADLVRPERSRGGATVAAPVFSRPQQPSDVAARRSRATSYRSHPHDPAAEWNRCPTRSRRPHHTRRLSILIVRGLVDLLRSALARVVDTLEPRERLRLMWYYVEQLTLAQIGPMLKEHEATVSRQLARTRRTIREQVENAIFGPKG